METGDTEPMTTPDETPHSRSLRALEWGTLVKVLELKKGYLGSPSNFLTFPPADFVLVKSLAKICAQGGILFHMLARPDTNLEHPLKFFG
jgi:hypothetical protein